MAWTAIRSPVPEFGGRSAQQKDIDEYDEATPNHQYKLVFCTWDAALDERYREMLCFLPVDEQTQRAYEAAMEHVDSLGEVITAQHSGDTDNWAKACMANISEWAGDGIRLT